MENYVINIKGKVAYKVTDEGVFDWDTKSQSFTILSSRPKPKNFPFRHSYSKMAATFYMKEKEKAIRAREKKQLKKQDVARKDGAHISYFVNKKLKLAFKNTIFGVVRWNPIEQDFTSALNERENIVLKPMADSKYCSRDYAIRYMLNGGNIEDENSIITSDSSKKRKIDWDSISFMSFSILGWLGVGIFVFYNIFTPSFWSKPWYVYPIWLITVPLKLLLIYALGAFVGLLFMSITELVIDIFTCRDVPSSRSHSGWHL